MDDKYELNQAGKKIERKIKEGSNYVNYISSSGMFFPNLRDRSPKTKVLPAGVYEIGNIPMTDKIFFSPMSISSDALVELNESAANTIIEDVHLFMSEELKERYKKYGLLHKRGAILEGPPGTGKCLGKGTPVLMVDGTLKKVEDIIVGDILMGDDNSPRTVLSLARGREMMYKVSQLNGDDYVVNESHILSLKGSGNDKTELRDSVLDITVKDYIQKSNNFKHHYKGYKAECSDFGNQKVELPGYLLGYWLGDGTTGRAEFTTMDSEVVDTFKEYAKTVGLEVKSRAVAGKATTYHIGRESTSQGLPGIPVGERNQFLNELRALECKHSKNIPDIVKKTSREYRLDFLAGLIDSDGSLSGNGFEFSNINENIARGVVFIGRSLGFRVSISERYTNCQSKANCHSYRVFISGDCSIIPTKIARKKAKKRVEGWKNHLYCGIKVEAIGIDDYYGFEIDGNRRFLLGDFTVTHNTVTLTQIARGVMEKYDAIVLFNPSIDDTIKALRVIKDIEPDKPVVVMYEEFDSLMGGSSESVLLTLLDGQISMSGVYFLCTTNYISRIPARMKNRPSRFALVVTVKKPTKADREKYIRAKLPEESETLIASLIDNSNDMVIDQIKDLILSICVFQYPMADAVRKIKEMQKEEVGHDDYNEANAKSVFKSLIEPEKKPLRPL